MGHSLGHPPFQGYSRATSSYEQKGPRDSCSSGGFARLLNMLDNLIWGVFMSFQFVQGVWVGRRCSLSFRKCWARGPGRWMPVASHSFLKVCVLERVDHAS